MITKAETTKNTSNRDELIWAMGFLIPLAIIAFVDFAPEYLTPMNFFICAVMALSVTALIAFLSTYKGIQKVSGDYSMSLISFCSALFVFFVVHWIVLLVARSVPGVFLFYEFITAIALFVSIMVSDSQLKFFGTEIRTSLTLLLGTCMAIALILWVLPNGVTNDPRFPMLFLFTTLPFLLFGGMALRSNESNSGVILASPFILAANDFLLLKLNIFDFTSDLGMQLFVLVIFTVVCKGIKELTVSSATQAK